MSVEAFIPDNVRVWLHHAPQEPTVAPAPGLRGFVINNYFYCARCCGRLSGRGILLPKESTALWTDRHTVVAECDACGNKV